MGLQRKKRLARGSKTLRRTPLRRKPPRARAQPERAVVRPPSELEHAFQVLELEPTEDLGRVRAAYRALVARFHPDKSAQRGPELRRAAEAQTRAIIRAYELVEAFLERS